MPARGLGINHVALEVGDIDEALAFYARHFDVRLRGRIGDRMAFIDLGDQFIALSAAGTEARHFGLVVDEVGEHRVTDPWGNVVEFVRYGDVQFTKAPAVLDGMGAGDVDKSPAALDELREKGLGGGMESAVPILPARDVAALAEWYRDRLGFEVRFTSDEYGIVARDRMELHLWGPSGIAPEDSNTMVRIGVADVDAACAELAGLLHSNGALETKPWGLREFSVVDGDGNLLTFFGR